MFVKMSPFTKVPYLNRIIVFLPNDFLTQRVRHIRKKKTRWRTTNMSNCSRPGKKCVFVKQMFSYKIVTFHPIVTFNHQNTCIHLQLQYFCRKLAM